MKKTMKKLISMVLSLIMVISLIPIGTISAQAGTAVWASSFTPRTTAAHVPTANDKWIVKYDISNNCTRYCYGRISEILNTDATALLGSRPDASRFDELLSSHGYQYGTTPKPGAVFQREWYDSSGNKCRHVAIVEAVNNASGTMIVSEGHSYYNANKYSGAIVVERNGSGIIGKDTNTYEAGRDTGTWFDIRTIYLSSTEAQTAKYFYLLTDNAKINDGSSSKEKKTTTQKKNTTTKAKKASTTKKVTLIQKITKKANAVYTAVVNTMNKYFSQASSPIPSGAKVEVHSVTAKKLKSGNYVYVSKVKYNGKEYEINLDYIDLIEPVIVKPDPPVVTLTSAQDVALGELISVSWNSPDNANYYSAILKDSNGNQIERQNDIYSNSISFQPANPGKYTVEVIAHNSEYSSDAGKLGKTVTVHDLVTVTFMDSDGETVLGKERIPWGKNAVAVIAPEKAGYTFRSWDKSLFGIKNDMVITAQYDKTKFRVQFIGYQTDDESESNIPSIEKPIGEPQLVEYGEDAEVPDASKIPIPKNYEFLGWSSEKYKNVYSPYKDETINIYAVYGWKNKDLPIECEIVRAERQTNGYYVYYKLTNYPDEITRGRVIVALKTASGKLVDMTESSAFSLEKNETDTNARIFVPCEKAATTAEIYVVNGYTNNGMSDGIPISNMDSDVIIEGKVWSEWQTTPITDPNAETQQREEYRFRNVHIETAHTSKKPYGWVTLMKDNTIYKGMSPTYQERSQQSLNETYTYVKDYTQAKRDISWGNWSNFSWTRYDAFDNESNKREIQQKNNVPKAWKTQYNYSRWSNSASGGSRFGPCAGSWSNIYCGNYQEHGWTDSPLGWVYTKYSSQYGGDYSCYNSTSNPWYNQNTRQVVSETGIQYSYRDGTYNYTFYYWDEDDWSNWSPDEVTATSTREIDKRTVYREKKTSADEDVSGEERETTGNVGEEYAGKNIMLFVSKYNAISDFTDEYVAQSKVADDGSYYFKYTLREEPSAETGDFTVMIGLEGSTQKQVVETIEAPKPVYTVKFYDNEKSKNPHIMYEVRVRQGDAADVPTDNPEIEGMRFICWNDSCTNVQNDLDIYPVLEPEEYIVTFVDTRNSNEKPTVNIQRFHYGDDLVAPTVKVEVETENDQSGETVLVDGELADVESGTNGYWDFEEGTKVTSDMVIYSKYTTKQYSVTFYDDEGNVVDEQTVEYDGVAEAPELPDDENDNAEYYGWDIEKEDLFGIKEDIAVFPTYDFKDDTPEPSASIETGAYDSAQTIELSCSDEDAIIYYTLDGTDPKDNPYAEEYTEPIVVSEKTELQFYASSLCKNDSEIVSNYYVINNDGLILTVHKDVYDSSQTFLINNLSDVDETALAIEGYTLDGVYYDSNYTEQADFNNTTLTGILDVYAHYSVNYYTVTFAEEDGTIIDTQSVEFTKSAIEPQMDDVDTLKFIGWDTYDFENVTAELVVHPIYKDISDIITVSFDRNKYQLEANGTYQINANVTSPDEYSDYSNLLTWASEDESVAVVNNVGEVTAVGEGTTTIYAITIDEADMAEIEITVSPSVNDAIILNNLSSLDVDSEGYLRRIPLDGTNTVDFVSSQIINSNDLLTFTNAKGETITGANKVGTNTVISLKNGSDVLDSMTVIMTGDITCDGLVNNRDVSYAARVIVKRNTADAGQLRAMDVNGDGKVNNRDVAMLSRYLVGKEQISN